MVCVHYYMMYYIIFLSSSCCCLGRCIVVGVVNIKRRRGKRKTGDVEDRDDIYNVHHKK